SQKIACAPYAKRPAGRQYVHCIPSPSTHPNAITACFERRVAKCYRVKLGEALPWCCVLLLRRIAVRVGRRAWRSFAQRFISNSRPAPLCALVIEAALPATDRVVHRHARHNSAHQSVISHNQCTRNDDCASGSTEERTPEWRKSFLSQARYQLAAPS